MKKLIIVFVFSIFLSSCNSYKYPILETVSTVALINTVGGNYIQCNAFHRDGFIYEHPAFFYDNLGRARRYCTHFGCRFGGRYSITRFPYSRYRIINMNRVYQRIRLNSRRVRTQRRIIRRRNLNLQRLQRTRRIQRDNTNIRNRSFRYRKNNIPLGD